MFGARKVLGKKNATVGIGSPRFGPAEVSVESSAPIVPLLVSAYSTPAPIVQPTARELGLPVKKMPCSVKGAEVRASAAVGDAARSVDHQAIVRRGDEADFAARRSEPVQARLGVHAECIAQKEPRSAEGRAGEIEGLAQGRPVEVGYDAEHERPGLPVVAGLAAADKAALPVPIPPGNSC